MRNLATIAGVAMVAATGAHAQQLNFVSDANVRTPLESSTHKTKLGAFVEEHVYEDMVEKTVTFPLKSQHTELYDRADLLESLSDELKTAKESAFTATNAEPEHAPIYKCGERFYNTDDPTEAYAFLPTLLGIPSEAAPTQTFEGLCYQTIDVTYTKISDTSFELLVDLQDKKSMFCKDGILFANNNLRHFEIFFRAGQHKITFNTETPEAQADVSHNGINMFLVCDGIVHELESVFRFAELFIGGMSLNPDPSKYFNSSYVPQHMEDVNLRFLRTAMNYTMEKREITKVVIDENDIHSGDFFPVIRMDGLAPMIMYGSGSYGSHSVVALWYPDGLYMVESTDGWYWPVGGIQKTPFKQWMEQAERASYYVSHLPLNEETRAKFNEEAAREFAEGAIGLPYGYHNFLWGWIDTARDNMPPALPAELLPVAFAWLETFDPTLVTKYMGEALNKRLGTEGLSLVELTMVAAERDMSLLDVMAMVEVDGWEYSDGRSMVCSAFVTGVWKAAGLFEDNEINATEFTPGDVYRMKFYDETTPRPQQCIDADPQLSFCQLLGNYRMYLPQYNTVEPYSHMNEHCTTINPDYFRPEGC